MSGVLIYYRAKLWIQQSIDLIGNTDHLPLPFLSRNVVTIVNWVFPFPLSPSYNKYPLQHLCPKMLFNSVPPVTCENFVAAFQAVMM